MKLFDLVENGRHKILAEVNGERFDAHLVDIGSQDDLGELNAFFEKAKEEGKKISLLDNGEGGIKIILDEEEFNVGVACEDAVGNMHTFIPSGGDLAPLVLYIAQIGGNKYETLEEALNVVNKGETIDLLSDIDISESGIIVTSDKDFSLNMNGFSIKAINNSDGNIRVEGRLTLMDSTDVRKNGNGKGKLFTETPYVKSKMDKCVVEVMGGGLFTMNSGLIDTASFTKDPANEGQFAVGLSDVTATTDASVVINGGHIKAGWYAVAGNGNAIKANHNITINGGLLESVADYAIYAPQKGTTTVNDGIVYGTAGGVQLNRGDLIINGGVVTSKGVGDTGDWGDGTGGTGCAAINANAKYATVNVDIGGGRFTAEGDSLVIATGSKYPINVEVTGGLFSDDISEYVADGYEVVKDDDSYKVVAK